MWEQWQRECLMWARTADYRKAVAKATRIVLSMAGKCPSAYVAYSGGKDSTAMLHLVSSVVPGVKAMSVKDDMDFPGEEAYVKTMAARFGVALDVIKPDFSCEQWLSDNAADIAIDGDMHSRHSDFSTKAFYSLVESYRKSHGSPGVYLGLRAAESGFRMKNRNTRGPIYEKKTGEVVCQPLCDWSGRDLYAYIFSNGIELLPLYKCVRFAKSPDKIRKSWWLVNYPKIGGFLWLKSYYPSLWARMRLMFPEAQSLA